MKALFIAMVFFAGMAMLHCQIQDGVYFIKSANDQGNWDLCGAFSCTPEAVDLFTYPQNGFNSQTLTVTNLGNGFYTITQAAFNFAVTYAQSNDPVATLFISQYNPVNTNQQFALVARSDGTYLIKPRDLDSLAIKSPAVGPNYAQIFLAAKSCTALDQRYNFVPVNGQPQTLRASKSEGGIREN